MLAMRSSSAWRMVAIAAIMLIAHAAVCLSAASELSSDAAGSDAGSAAPRALLAVGGSASLAKSRAELERGKTHMYDHAKQPLHMYKHERTRLSMYKHEARKAGSGAVKGGAKKKFSGRHSVATHARAAAKRHKRARGHAGRRNHGGKHGGRHGKHGKHGRRSGRGGKHGRGRSGRGKHGRNSRRSSSKSGSESESGAELAVGPNGTHGNKPVVNLKAGGRVDGRWVPSLAQRKRGSIGSLTVWLHPESSAEASRKAAAHKWRALKKQLRERKASDSERVGGMIASLKRCATHEDAVQAKACLQQAMKSAPEFKPDEKVIGQLYHQ